MLHSVGDVIKAARGKNRNEPATVIAVDAVHQKYATVLADGTVLMINEKNLKQPGEDSIETASVLSALARVRNTVGISHRATDLLAEYLGLTEQFKDALTTPTVEDETEGEPPVGVVEASA